MLFINKQIICRLSICILLCIESPITPADNSEDLSNDPLSLVKQFNNAKCCVYVDELESIELGKGTSIEIDLSESGDLLELSTGPTFAKLISIPDSNKTERYSVRTGIIEYDNELFAFFPYVALLDADFNLLGTTYFNRLNYVQKEFIFVPQSHLRFRFIVDANIDKDDGVKYFLIYTRAKHFTNSNISDLKGKNRNISLGEISVRLNDIMESYPTKSDIINGLPAGTVKITHRQRKK